MYVLSLFAMWKIALVSLRFVKLTRIWLVVQWKVRSHRMWFDGWCSLEVKLISLKAVCWLLIEEVMVFLYMTQVSVLWYLCSFEPGSSTAECVCLTVDGCVEMYLLPYWILILLYQCGELVDLMRSSFIHGDTDPHQNLGKLTLCF